MVLLLILIHEQINGNALLESYNSAVFVREKSCLHHY